MTTIEALIAAAHLSLGCLFMFAAVGKLRNWESLRRSVDQLTMKRLPDALSRFVAVGLPPVELALGVGLLVGVHPEIFAAIAAALLAVFSLLIAMQLWRGNRVPCHCFGDSGAVIGPGTLVRNLLLLAMALGTAGSAWAHPAQAFALSRLFGLSSAEVAGLTVVVVNMLVMVLALSESSAVLGEP